MRERGGGQRCSQGFSRAANIRPSDSHRGRSLDFPRADAPTHSRYCSHRMRDFEVSNAKYALGGTACQQDLGPLVRPTRTPSATPQVIFRSVRDEDDPCGPVALRSMGYGRRTSLVRAASTLGIRHIGRSLTNIGKRDFYP